MLDLVRNHKVLGLNLAVYDSGGPGLPVVFLHGSGCSMRVFAHQLDCAALHGFRAIAFDLPGHGASDDAILPAETYSLRGFAAVTQGLLERLGVERAVLVGWSLGGHVAMEMLATNPMVAGAMIVGTPPIPLGLLGMLRGFCAHWDVFLASKEHFTARDEARFLKLCFGVDAGDRAFIDALRRADGRVRPSFVRSILRGKGADERRAVETSNVPLAVVNGADEPFARLGYVAGLDYRNLWRGQPYVIPGAGHAPFWQQPEIFNGLLRDFVASVAATEAVTDKIVLRKTG